MSDLVGRGKARVETLTADAGDMQRIWNFQYLLEVENKFR